MESWPDSLRARLLQTIIRDNLLTAHATISRICLVDRRWHRLASADWVWMYLARSRWPDNFTLAKCQCAKSQRDDGFGGDIIYHPIYCFQNTAVDCWRVNVRQGLRRDRAVANQMRKETAESGPEIFLRSGSTRAICPDCQRPLNTCLCAVLDRLGTICNCGIRLIVLLHPKCPLGTGTLRLLVRLLRYCTVFRGFDFSRGRFPELDRMLDEEASSGRTFLLYPAADAQEVCQAAKTANSAKDCREMKEGLGDYLHSQQPVTIIVIDGTWSQAKWMYRWNAQRLASIPKIRLLPSKPAVYARIRREPKPHCLSTAEAAAMAIDEWAAASASATLDCSLSALCMCGTTSGRQIKVLDTILIALEEIVETQLRFERV